MAVGHYIHITMTLSLYFCEIMSSQICRFGQEMGANASISGKPLIVSDATAFVSFKLLIQHFLYFLIFFLLL